MARNYKQGFFKPQNPSKYRGNLNEIIYRSGWEENIFRSWDLNKNIIEWAAESVIIPYQSPIDKKIHRYYMDGWIKAKTIHNTVEQILIEIKPYAQCFPPQAQKRKTKQYIERVKTYLVNQAKWNATIKFCQKHKLKFAIMTEKGVLDWNNIKPK